MATGDLRPVKEETEENEEKDPIVLTIQYTEAGGTEAGGTEARGLLHKLSFETYKNTSLRRVFLDFCDSLDLIYSTMVFYFDGKHIKKTQSAQEFGLKDGDLIDAFNNQLAGGAAAARDA